MSFFQRMDRHAQLMNQMADTIGADIGAGLVNGQISDQTLRSAYLRCTGCQEGAACASFLDAHEEGAATPPAYCRNSDLLQSLKV